MTEEFISFEQFLEIDEEKRYVTAVVQSPGKAGTEEEIEKACHEFMEFRGKIRGADLMQNWIVPVPMPIHDQEIRQGCWIMKLHINDPDMWHALTEESAEDDEIEEQLYLETSATTPNADKEINISLNKEADMTGEQKEKIIKALTEGNLTETAQHLIMKETRELTESDPTLSEAQALEKVMKTDYGKACYKLHSAGYRREARASGLGPVAKEVLERKERLIEKSGARLSEGEAYNRVFKQDLDLYRRYVREVEVSTAVT